MSVALAQSWLPKLNPSALSFLTQTNFLPVPAQRLEFRQVLHRSLAALAGEFKPVVLVNTRGALGLDAGRANQAQSFDQLWKIARRSCISGLP
jgi:hypothetical protein